MFLLSKFSKRFRSYCTKAGSGLNGLFVPMITPFKQNQRINTHLLHGNLQMQNNDKNISGVVLFGSTGEGPFLSLEEKNEILEIAKPIFSKSIICSVYEESIYSAIEAMENFYKKGAILALVLPPRYYRSKMSAKGVEAFFVELAKHSPMPIIIYDFPLVSGVSFSYESLVELVDIEQIVGVKDSSKEIIKYSLLAKYIRERDINFTLLSGSASYILPSYSIGFRGTISALANIFPNKVHELHNDCKMEGNKAFTASSILNLHYQLTYADDAITTKCGIAGIKSVMNHYGMEAGVPRKPIHEMSEQKTLQLIQELSSLGLV